MAAKRKPLPFKPQGPPGKPASGKAASGKQKGDKPASGGNVIPRAVANRMAVRIAIATGVPSVLGMAVFVASYLLVSRGIFDIPPVLTLAHIRAAASCSAWWGSATECFSASWEDKPGSTLGFEQIGVNIPRLRASIRAMGQGSGSKTPPAG